jgi:hypothetical protein
MNATQAIDSIVKLLGLQFKKETFKSTMLEDGSLEVTNNSESEFEVGQTLYIVKDATLEPAPEGTHTTREGLVLTVDSESTIIAIMSNEVESTEVESEDEMGKSMMYTVAEDAQGQKLESPTFDVGEEVYLIKEDGTKEPAPNGEHQVVLKDESGNENKIRIQVLDGKITQRENVEGMKKNEMMGAEFKQELNDIKSSMTELLSVLNEMNGKFKTELNSLKSEFESFKKSPETKAINEKKTFVEDFADYKVQMIKQMSNFERK